ncbi:MAG: VWA domain-containing protein [Caldilinea sp.]|nr:VWA domain-containing protein [Caldilinea sp.]
MTFIWPYFLLSLLLAPLVVWLYLRGQRRRRQVIAGYAALGFVQSPAGRTLGWRRHPPYALFLVGLILFCVALARPQATLSLPRLEGVVILAFDVSGSMAATDLEPSRMEAARAAAIDFIQRQPSTVRVGIVAFSESGFTVQPPTNDQAALLATVNRLRPERGTSLASGILAALNTIFATPEPSGAIYSSLTPTPSPTPTPAAPGSYESAAIVLLTDGENTAPPEPLESAQIAADRGVRIYTIGIGSTAGTTIEIEGMTFFTRLDAETLQRIAEMTDGEYFNAQDEEELSAIYRELDVQLVTRPEKTEVTALFAGVALLLLIGGAALSMVWLGRAP